MREAVREDVRDNVREDVQAQSESIATPLVPATGPACLNCGASLAGEFCSACGQQVVDLAAPTWNVMRAALADATDVDGRVLRTLRALCTPGRLTADYLQGRRVPYIGPAKLFLLAGTALTTTWITTRGIDAHYYGYDASMSAVAYIKTVVRGLLAGSLVVAVGAWVLGARRRRLLDESVFALHLVAALALLASLVIWLAAAWKVAWGSVHNVPAAVPALHWLMFIPAALLGLAYIMRALQRVHGGAWWAALARAIVLAMMGFAVLMAMLRAGGPS